MKKRIVSLLLCIVMCLSLFPMSAFAEGNLSFAELMTIGAKSGKMINEKGVVFTISRNDTYATPRFDDRNYMAWWDSSMAEQMTVDGNVYTVMSSGRNGADELITTTFAFTVENDTVVELTVSGFEGDRANRNGTYVIAHTHDFTGDYKDNGDGTHSRKCTGCDVYDTAKAHSYTNGVCVCGAKNLADYSAVTDALNACKALKASDYTSDSWQALQNAIKGVVYDLDADHQAEVDAMAKTIVDAIDALVEKTFNLKVTVNGNVPSDEEFGKFRFYFDELRRPGTAEPWVNLKTTTNGSENGNGDIDFRSMSYSYEDEGAHWYRFYEDQGAVEGYALDQTVFYLKVIVQRVNTEYLITDYWAFRATLGADVYDNAGVVDKDKLTAIAPDDMVFSNKDTAGELIAAKNAAKSAINSAVGGDNSSSVQQAANKAIADIEDATTVDEVNAARDAGIQAIQSAQAANELADAKKNAIGTINAYKSDVNASIADAAIADINNATTAAEVSNIVNQTIPKLLAADKKAEFKGKITNELLPAAKCDEAKAILNKALTDLDDAVTLDEVNTVFYNAQGQANGKDSEFAGMLAGYTNAFNSAITDVATDETKAFASEMLKALDEATSIARINEIYNSNKDKISVCINRDKSVDDFNKYIDSDKYSDEMKAIAREAIEKLMQAESVSDVEKITKDYKLKLDVQEDKETMRGVLASDEYSDEMKALAQNALDELDDVTTSQELTNLWDKYNPLMRLQLTKDDARKEVKELLPENASDAVKKIVSDACDEIQANDDPDQYADIIKAAAEAIKAQLQKEAELAPAKEAAIAEINDAKTDANASVAEEAVKAINNAQSEDEISALKEQALDDMAAADAAAELTAAKEEAIEEINKAKTDANASVAEEAVKAINDATSVDEVSTLKEQALADMAAADAAAELAAAKDAAKETILAEQGDDTSEAVAKAVEAAIAAIEAATTVDEVNAAMEDGIAAIRAAKAGNVPPTPVTYTILNGANSVWTKGSTSGLVVRSDAPFAKFVGVKVDGKTIAATNYTAEEGSTIVTLKSAYLETLETGKHSLEIVSADGSASTSFTVKANSQPADPTDPQTGDSSMIYLWMLILAISAAGLSVTTVYSRKRRNHK